MMVNVILCILTALVSHQNAYALFTYDRAVHAAHKGNWPYAHSLLNQLVVDDPRNPSKVYDAGVAAYKLKDFKQAEAYFATAAKAAERDKELQEKALFNQGNAQAQQKKLKEAITSYESALAIKPGDVHAQHNLELVKKMLEEEQKQQQNQQQDQKDQKQQEQDKQNKQQDKQDGAKSQQQQSSDKDERKQDKDQQEKDSNKDNQQDDKDKNKPNENQGDQEESKKNQSQKDEKQQQESQQSGEREKQEPTQSPGQAEEKSLKNDMAKKIDAHLAQVLEAREQRDGELNKQFIKAQVGKQLTGHHGQNCW